MPRTEDAPAQPRNHTLVARLWALAGLGRAAATVLDIVITIGDADAGDTCPWLSGAALRARVARVVELAQRERDRDAFAAALHATATPAQA